MVVEREETSLPRALKRCNDAAIIICSMYLLRTEVVGTKGITSTTYYEYIVKKNSRV